MLFRSPDASPRAPDTSPRTPDASPHAPHTSPCTPDTLPRTPDASPCTPDASHRAPYASPCTPDASPRTPDASPHAPAPQLGPGFLLPLIHLPLLSCSRNISEGTMACGRGPVCWKRHLPLSGLLPLPVPEDPLGPLCPGVSPLCPPPLWFPVTVLIAGVVGVLGPAPSCPMGGPASQELGA